MRRGRTLILLALILLVGALAAFLILRSISGGGDGETPPDQPEVQFEGQIVIASQDIPVGREITGEEVVISPYPADLIVETMVTDRALVIGRIARMDIPRGVPVTENMVTQDFADIGPPQPEWALRISEGDTAIAIPMNRLSGVAYALRPGVTVDVLITMLMIDVDPEFQTTLPNDLGILVAQDGTLQSSIGGRKVEIDSTTGSITLSDDEPPPQGRLDTEEFSGLPIYAMPSEDQRARLVTQRLISGAIVLDVGTFPLPGAAVSAVVAADQGVGAQTDPTTGQPVPPPTPPPPDIITLVVSPQEALALNWAIKGGLDLVMTLRNPADETDTLTDSVTLEYLVDNFDITIPGKPSFGLVPRVDEAVRPQLPNDDGTPPQ